MIVLQKETSQDPTGEEFPWKPPVLGDVFRDSLMVLGFGRELASRGLLIVVAVVPPSLICCPEMLLWCNAVSLFADVFLNIQCPNMGWVAGAVGGEGFGGWGILTTVLIVRIKQ